MGMKERIKQDLKDAMKSKDQVKVRTLRMILTTIRNIEVEKMKEATDEDVMDALQKEAKKRREAIEQYEKAGRNDLADEERKELSVIEKYLPEQMSEEEIKGLAKEIIEQLGASTVKDLGKIMKKIMPKVKGRADGKLVNRIVRELLQQ